MTDWPRLHVAGDRGSDRATGTESSPYRTLRKALREFEKLGTAGEILLRDCLLEESVVIEISGLTIRGMGENLSGGSSKIRAPSEKANCIEIRAPEVRLDNIVTVGRPGIWKGHGFRIHKASHAKLYDCFHTGWPTTTCDATSGGTALKVSWGEGHDIRNFRFRTCRRGVHQSTEATGLRLTNTRGSNASCEALRIDGTPVGGIRIRDWKSTHCANANGGLVAYLGPDPSVSAGGQGIYEGFDLDEASWPTRVEVLSHANSFRDSCSAPNTRFDVTGNINGFDGFKINGERMHVTGDKNRLDRMQIAGTLIVDGQGNKVGLCDNDDSHKLVLGQGNSRF